MSQRERPSPGTDWLWKTVAQRHHNRLDKLRLCVHHVTRCWWSPEANGVLQKVELCRKEVESAETGDLCLSPSQLRQLAGTCRAHACTAVSVHNDARKLEMHFRQEVVRRTTHGKDKLTRSQANTDALELMLAQCAELRQAAAGARQDLAGLAMRVDSLVAALPNGKTPIGSRVDATLASVKRDSMGKAEVQGGVAMSEPMADGDTDDINGDGCLHEATEVARSFALVARFLARFYVQDSHAYWHADNMLHAQQCAPSGLVPLLGGRFAGMHACRWCVVCVVCARVRMHACACVSSVRYCARLQDCVVTCPRDCVLRRAACWPGLAPY